MDIDSFIGRGDDGAVYGIPVSYRESVGYIRQILGMTAVSLHYAFRELNLQVSV